jgi:Fe-S cluster assembly iron-binding protein IscA
MAGLKLDVTPEAQRIVRQVLRTQRPGTVVRVYAQPGGGRGGGCCGADGGCGTSAGGPTFQMALDRPRTGDVVLPVDGFTVVVDPESAEFLQGGTIDFVRHPTASGFRVRAPRVPDGEGSPSATSETAACGCGAAGGCS